MQIEVSKQETNAAEQISDLVYSDKAPREFWAGLIAAMCKLGGAERGYVLFQKRGLPDEKSTWRKLAEWASENATTALRRLSGAQQKCIQVAEAVVEGRDDTIVEEDCFVIAVRLTTENAEDACAAVFLFGGLSESQVEEARVRLKLCAAAPRGYQLGQSVRKGRDDVEKFARVLDLLTVVNDEDRFLASGMALCNSIASNMNCDRVSLGWFERGFIRLRAISRMEKFDRQMAAAKSLEVAMDESYDQDDDVIWPEPEDAGGVISRDHAKFAKEQDSGHVVSLPIRHKGEAQAVITCERADREFNETELQQLRLAADLAAPRLVDLKESDRWFGARWASSLRRGLAKIVGPKHTWPKVITLLLAALLAVLLFVHIEYRVEGEFILKSEKVAFMTAPYEGYISEVFVRPGTLVTEGDILLKLNTEELDLQKASAVAEVKLHTSEAEMARGRNRIAESRTSEARAEKAKANLDVVRHRLKQAEIRAPFDGIIIEGDLRERLGTPLKQGDGLFKIARIDSIYIEAEVPEADVHEILGKREGEIAFVSRPDLKFPMKIRAVEPAAIPKEEGNVFIVRCDPAQKVEEWWRPGMSGICKINVEDRSLLWIVSHRTVDFIRLHLWW